MECKPGQQSCGCVTFEHCKNYFCCTTSSMSGKYEPNPSCTAIGHPSGHVYAIFSTPDYPLCPALLLVHKKAKKNSLLNTITIHLDPYTQTKETVMRILLVLIFQLQSQYPSIVEHTNNYVSECKLFILQSHAQCRKLQGP